MAKLGEVCDFYAGTGFPNEYQGRVTGKYPFYKVGDISKNVSEGNRELKTCANYVEEDVVQKLKGSILPPKTIVFAKIGEALKLNRRAITSCECLVDNNVMGIKAQNARLNDEYLFYWLQNLNLSDYSESTTVPSVKKSRLQNIEINVSPLEEQEKVVSTLNKLSSLILARKKQLSKLDELVKARFVEMFGDSKLNPNNFPCNSLSEYIVFLTSGSRGWSQYFTDSGEYFITIKNVKNCKITLQDVQCVTPPDNAEAKRTRIQENDLLISITADLGRTGIVTKKIAEHGAYINQHLTCIRLKQDKLNPLYVAYYMESDAGKEQFIAKNQSAVKAGLNFNAINSLKLMAPPLALQNQFAAFVERVDQQKQTVQQSLEKLELMKKALMQEYFG